MSNDTLKQTLNVDDTEYLQELQELTGDDICVILAPLRKDYKAVQQMKEEQIRWDVESQPPLCKEDDDDELCIARWRE